MLLSSYNGLCTCLECIGVLRLVRQPECEPRWDLILHISRLGTLAVRRVRRGRHCLRLGHRLADHGVVAGTRRHGLVEQPREHGLDALEPVLIGARLTEVKHLSGQPATLGAGIAFDTMSRVTHSILRTLGKQVTQTGPGDGHTTRLPSLDGLLLIDFAASVTPDVFGPGHDVTLLGAKHSLVLEPLEHLVEARSDRGTQGRAEPVDPV